MASLLKASSLDSNRFGIRVARAAVTTPEEAGLAHREALEAGYRMAIARCPASQLGVAQALEGVGFLLMDTLVYYGARLGQAGGAVALEGFALGAASRGDAAGLEEVARHAFRGYRGHYHADPRLDPEAATEGYVEWCLRSLETPQISVLVAREGDRVAGFLTLRRGEGREPAEIELNGVAPWAQRRGVYDALLRLSLAEARAQGAAEIVVSTQIDNLAPQKVWVRNGLEPRGAYYTFHRWYDAP